MATDPKKSQVKRVAPLGEVELANATVESTAASEAALLAENAAQRSEAIARLEKKLGHAFTSRELIDRALTHRSALEGKFDDYERLEFLGDAVIDLAVAHLLVEGHPTLTEGDLSKMRAALVNTQALADLANELDLGPLIRLGRAEKAGGGQSRPALLADVFEALTGVLYRDAGFPRTLEIVETLFRERVATVKPRDPKTELQEILQAVGGKPPEYLLEFIEGPEHSPVFVSIVKIEDTLRGRGRGQTKKASQQAAASEALEALRAEAKAGPIAGGAVSPAEAPLPAAADVVATEVTRHRSPVKKTSLLSSQKHSTQKDLS